MLSVTLTFEPMTLKMSFCHDVDPVVSNCDKVRPCIPEIGEQIPPKVPF